MGAMQHNEAAMAASSPVEDARVSFFMSFAFGLIGQLIAPTVVGIPVP
jgi:hypothetical protein